MHTALLAQAAAPAAGGGGTVGLAAVGVILIGLLIYWRAFQAGKSAGSVEQVIWAFAPILAVWGFLQTYENGTLGPFVGTVATGLLGFVSKLATAIFGSL
jgi:hypothetical protein